MTATPTPKKAPSNLRLRVIYGVLGAALLLGCVWYGPLTFGLFFGLVQAIMLWEFYRMMEKQESKPATWIGMSVSVIIYGLAFFLTCIYMSEGMVTSSPTPSTSGETHMLASSMGKLAFMRDALFWESKTWIGFISGTGILLVILTLFLILREMLVWPQHQQPFQNIGSILTGLLYITLPMSLLCLLPYSNNNHYDYRRIFALLFLIWASDIGAYAAGKTFGKHKMAPSISPGKTWEGWAGGFLLTLAVGWAVGFMLPELPLAHRLVAAAVVAVFAPLGDLAESMLKRSVGVKDSGRIMPGHGGLLDRFDAFLLVLPVLALLQLLFSS